MHHCFVNLIFVLSIIILLHFSPNIVLFCYCDTQRTRTKDDKQIECYNLHSQFFLKTVHVLVSILPTCWVSGVFLIINCRKMCATNFGPWSGLASPSPATIKWTMSFFILFHFNIFGLNRPCSFFYFFINCGPTTLISQNIHTCIWSRIY